MKIIESITNDYQTNQEIEEIIRAHGSSENTPAILDGLEQVFESHARGISVSEWMRAMESMGWSSEVCRQALDFIVAYFPKLVKREGDTLRWNDVPLHTDGDLDMSDPLTQMAKSQIEYTNQILELMKQHGQFTVRDIMAGFAAISGLPPQMVEMFVQHIIETNPSMIRQVGPGRYELAAADRPKTPSENMAMWRDLAARGIDPQA